MRLLHSGLLGCLLALSFTSAQAQQACDRSCLINVVDQYFAAMLAHDTSKVAIAPDARFVENITALQPGEGLWQTLTAVPSTFKIYVADPVAGEVGFIGLLREQDAPALIGLRLKVVDGQITEMEHVIAANIAEGNLANLQTPRPGLLAEVPAAQRSTREKLLAIGRSYYDAVDDNDGALTPFADDCVRRENGLQTAGPRPQGEELDRSANGFTPMRLLNCGPQLDTQTMGYIDSIINRRMDIADPVTGLVFGLSHFRQSMKTNTFAIVGMPGVPTRTINNAPWDLPAAHIIKITDNMVHEIEALGFFAPYRSPTGWAW